MYKILIIGDMIYDEYIIGSAKRISPEAPVPVVSVHKTEFKNGGAGNVKLNVEALGSCATIMTQKKTTLKTRIVADGQIICRVDEDVYDPTIHDFSTINFKEYKYCIISDYNKGAIHYSQDIINTLDLNDIKTIVDPKKTFDNYINAWLIKPNWEEFKSEIKKYDLQKNDEESLKKYCNQLRIVYNIENFVITLGAEGIYLNTPNLSLYFKNPVSEVKDVTGAGDIVSACLAHFLNKGKSIQESIQNACFLASRSVNHMGTYVLQKEDLDLLQEKIIFTNGCFDILHRGHIEYLRESRKLGTKLIIGLNSDESIKRLKGPTRPYNNQNDRKIMLEALSFVDEVIVFDEDTPYELIKKIKPDVITKGGDYKVEDVVGNDLADVIIFPRIENLSTTEIIMKGKL